MTDYNIGNLPPWSADKYHITTIELPEEITYLGTYAFSYCRSKQSFVIPPKVTKITNRLFFECTNLSSIEIDENVTSVGPFAFASCISLPYFTLPPKITILSDNMFRECSNLISIKIHDDVKSIMDAAFYY